MIIVKNKSSRHYGIKLISTDYVSVAEAKYIFMFIKYLK